MKKRTLSAITITALMSAGIAFAANDNAHHEPQPPMHGQMTEHFAKPDGKHNPDRLPHGFNQLGLTDAQKARIKQIMQADRPAQPASHEQQRSQFQQKMQQRQAQERALMSNKTFDEQAARRMIAERQQERAELERQHAERELQHLKTRHAIFQVLTAKQQQQFLDNQKQHDTRFIHNNIHPQGNQPTSH